MVLALKAARTSVGAVPLGTLPASMRLLFISTHHRTGAWLAEAFAHDSATTVSLEEALGMANGLARLRDEAYDAVLISHEPGALDALDLTEALRGGGSEEPIILLGAQSEQELAPAAFEAGADAYVCVHTTTTRSLIWIVARAIERHRLIHENRRLSQAEQHRLQLEHVETRRLLDEQRSVLRDLEAVAAGAGGASAERCRQAELQRTDGATVATPPPNLPVSLVAHYHELMRSYVIMGAGNLGDDMARMADLMADAEISAPETMQLHVCVLEEMVRGLGTRSARHVMTRADLLVLEVMVHLSEVYRRRYFERRYPARQMTLFE